MKVKESVSLCKRIKITAKHTEEGGQTSDDGNDEVSRRRDGGTGNSLEIAVLALAADRADAFILPLILVVDTSGSVPARTPQALVYVAASTGVFTLTDRATKKRWCATTTNT